jgi:WD40 repeat protein
MTRVTSTVKDFQLATPGIAYYQTLRHLTGCVVCAAWSPNGLSLASGGEDGFVRVWEVRSGRLRMELAGHAGPVLCVAWSPDGRSLSSGGEDGTVRVWDTQHGKMSRALEPTVPRVTRESVSGGVYGLAWSPDGRTTAAAYADATIRLFDAEIGRHRRTIRGHAGPVLCVAWSPDGRWLASGGEDGTVRVWEAEGGKPRSTLRGHTGGVASVAWSPNGALLASGGESNHLEIWETEEWRPARSLPTDVDVVVGVGFSYDGRLLASRGDKIQIYRTEDWDLVGVINEPLGVKALGSGLAFHPKVPTLATYGTEGRAVRLWGLDVQRFCHVPPLYASAKILIVGDAGAGKTSLASALAPDPRARANPADRVFKIDRHEVTLDDGRTEVRETFLWDFPSQRNSHLINQFYFNDVVVAIVVFDPGGGADSFASVRKWDHALRHARTVFKETLHPLKKFLVAARTDRGSRIDVGEMKRLVNELDFDGFFATSVREGRNVRQLADAVRDAILWDSRPKVQSQEFLDRVRKFIFGENEAGWPLSTAEDLYRQFLRNPGNPSDADEVRQQFEVCIGRLESCDTVKRLRFGNYVLLQPQLLDGYASAMVDAAKAIPDGLGCINEEDAKSGRFPPSGDRLEDASQEQVLLIATIEELLGHEIALLGHCNNGEQLIFPSHFTRVNPAPQEPNDSDPVWAFEGSVVNVYTALVVRLHNTLIFKIKDPDQVWKNCAVFSADFGGKCRISLRELDEGHGEFMLSFEDATAETQFYFEEFIKDHLNRWARRETIRKIGVVCDRCGYRLSDESLHQPHREAGRALYCPGCREPLLLDKGETGPVPAISRMNQMADVWRDKIATLDYDVFLAYSDDDVESVKQVGMGLKDRGVLPWLDMWESQSGARRQQSVDALIQRGKPAVVLYGGSGTDPLQDPKSLTVIRKFIDHSCPVVRVILSDRAWNPERSPILEGFFCVDFRKRDPDPWTQLVVCITGSPPVVMLPDSPNRPHSLNAGPQRV